MRKKQAINFETVRRLGLALPNVKEDTAYGTPALKVAGRMFACMASHKSAEPETLVAIIGFDRRDELIAAEPRTYYLKEHYVNYPTVLARLHALNEDALRDLLRMAWSFVSAKAKRRVPRRR